MVWFLFSLVSGRLMYVLMVEDFIDVLGKGECCGVSMAAYMCLFKLEAFYIIGHLFNYECNAM